MTLEELRFWGTPLYPKTLLDDDGLFPIGMVEPNGTITLCGTSNVGKQFSDGMAISWDGSMPDPNPGCHSKGRLLPVVGPAYVDSLIIFRYMWGKGLVEEDDETTSGTGSNESRKKKASRKERQPSLTEGGEDSPIQ